MRTKVFLALAALAVGLSTSMAQNVYSLNVVGYINVTMKASTYTLCANQLNNGTNGIAQVLTTPPDNALVLTFKNGDYNLDVAQGGAWFDYNTFNPSTTQLPPGVGWFYNNPTPSDVTVTLVGEVPQGTGLTVPLPSGYGLVGTYTPEALELSTANGFPLEAVDNTLELRYDNVLGDYVISVTQGGSWFDYNTFNPVTIKPAVGQGYFINNPGTATAWTRNFTVQ